MNSSRLPSYSIGLGTRERPLSLSSLASFAVWISMDWSQALGEREPNLFAAPENGAEHFELECRSGTLLRDAPHAPLVEEQPAPPFLPPKEIARVALSGCKTKAPNHTRVARVRRLV